MSQTHTNLKIQRIRRDQELGSLLQISYSPDQPVIYLWTRDGESVMNAYSEIERARGERRIGSREHTHFLYFMKKAGFNGFTPNDERKINGLLAIAEDLREEK
ncbi:hypothetical protein CO038_02725 [Candidatus Pacearchaeota archaeon CG_4_9_14_0_2_um_filter_39_13]|nr:hypothetical protein [Candidatus Pacearchaeota archaeon]OIO43091.1 MAG: hypothetical protein AUJ64_02820 [Candidatus Pacearchaeota archaeon CG1_02_39_14]PJC44631.1 MAG: hypothetical protein CO038_02725 [Candidatus Pacearchaeota archaeon CG_4_9_14_0_2_um_filter_39_13]